MLRFCYKPKENAIYNSVLCAIGIAMRLEECHTFEVALRQCGYILYPLKSGKRSQQTTVKIRKPKKRPAHV